MYAPLHAAFRPARILFLCNGESSVRNDARLLRALNVSDIHFCNDPQKALALLEEEALERSRGRLSTGQTLDLVLCDEDIKGKVGTFVHAMAQRECLRSVPVLVLLSGAARASTLAGAGVTALERPYAELALSEALQKAMSPLRRVLSPVDTACLAECAGQLKTASAAASSPKKRKRPMTTSDCYEEGLTLLKNGDHAGAASAFAAVLARNEDHVGAALGLAKSCRGLDDADGMRRALLRAAAACLRAGDRERALSIAALLPLGVRDKIYMHEALARMEEDDYRAAALGFLDAARESPGTPLHRVVARACLLSANPDQNMRRLCAAYDGLGQGATANVLRRRLLDYDPYDAPASASWLDRFPLLRDAVNVASHTALAWRHL
ncbi:hypothetical protein LJC15_04370 [Desulfovibrio sp. OttesenSCG-928-G11]|nr:hypothetical protein [Desulfovibrio sp. OttesenSCG-928-G11]